MWHQGDRCFQFNFKKHRDQSQFIPILSGMKCSWVDFFNVSDMARKSGLLINQLWPVLSTVFKEPAMIWSISKIFSLRPTTHKMINKQTIHQWVPITRVALTVCCILQAFIIDDVAYPMKPCYGNLSLSLLQTNTIGLFHTNQGSPTQSRKLLQCQHKQVSLRSLKKLLTAQSTSWKHSKIQWRKTNENVKLWRRSN